MPVIKKIFENEMPIEFYDKLCASFIKADFEGAYDAIVECIKYLNDKK